MWCVAFPRVHLVLAPRCPQIYTLSLHDALPISSGPPVPGHEVRIVDDTGKEAPERVEGYLWFRGPAATRDRKSTRLNSSHRCISYAVFCLKKKNTRNLSRS